MFRTHSYEIAKDVCRFVARGEDCTPAPAHRCVIMRSLVADTIKDRTQMMADLVRALDVKEREQLSLVRNIADQMFDDEQVRKSLILSSRIRVPFEYLSYHVQVYQKINSTEMASL